MTSASRLLSRVPLVLAILASLALQAQAQPAATAPIQELNAGLLQVMRAGKATPFQARMASLTPIVQRSFDLELILRNSVGPRFAGFSADQKAALLDSFTQFSDDPTGSDEPT